MKVPFIDLKSLAGLVKDNAVAAWKEAADHTAFVGGPKVQALEAQLAKVLGAEHAICCGSGTEALIIGLQALGIGPGSKVAMPNLTFWATYEAVVQLGAQPVLIDVDPDHLQLDLTELKAGFDKLRFDAVLLVHLMGWATPQLDELRRFCREAAIPLLEDGAQSFGVQVGGRSVYQGAQLSTLSFYPAKVLGGCMDGGAIMTDDAELAALIRTLCNHGRSSHYSYTHVGWNSRMSGLQAAWLLELLDHQESILSARRELEAGYLKALGDEALQGKVLVHRPPSEIVGNGYLSVLELATQDPEMLAGKLKEAGVMVGRTYPETLDQQPPAKDALRISDLTHSRQFCRRVLNLPLFYGMTTEQQGHVCESFVRVLGEES